MKASARRATASAGWVEAVIRDKRAAASGEQRRGDAPSCIVSSMLPVEGEGSARERAERGRGRKRGRAGGQEGQGRGRKRKAGRQEGRRVSGQPDRRTQKAQGWKCCHRIARPDADPPSPPHTHTHRKRRLRAGRRDAAPARAARATARVSLCIV